MSSIPLPPEIRQMSVPEKLDLIGQVWDSIEEENQKFELSAAQKAELIQRLEEARRRPREGSSWEEVRARLLTED